MARRHICDVPGCGAPRLRWQRLCERCFKALPGDIRSGIIEMWRQRRKGAWRAECKRAADHLAGALNPAQPGRISPAEAYERTARMLGEQP